MDNREEANRVRVIMDKAQETDLVTSDEMGFISVLVNRFRADIERKTQQLHTLSGEISQLRTNEKIIVDVVENIIAASERDKARQETLKNIKAEKTTKKTKKAKKDKV